MSPGIDDRADDTNISRRAWQLIAGTLLVLGLGILFFALMPAVAQHGESESPAAHVDEAVGHAGHEHAAGESAVDVPASDEHAADASPAKSKIAGTLCLVCKEPVSLDDITLTFRGRHIHLHAGRCVELWNGAKERFFATLQPRGALFQEGEFESRPGRAGGWLLLGLYVVVGLLFGGACAFLAIRRDLAPLPWFVAGLALNVIGFAALLTRASAGRPEPVTESVAGLTRPALTRQPVRCPECAASVHPAATDCPDCGTALVPTVEAETVRT